MVLAAVVIVITKVTIEGHALIAYPMKTQPLKTCPIPSRPKEYGHGEGIINQRRNYAHKIGLAHTVKTEDTTAEHAL